MSNLFINFLIVNLDDTNNDLAWNQKNGIASHLHLLIYNEVLSKLAFLVNVLITTDMHALNGKLGRVLPATRNLHVLTCQQLCNRLQVFLHD